MRLYLHPRRYRRGFRVWFYRVLCGKSRNTKISTLERQVSKAFYEVLAQPGIHMSHFVNGHFVKELIWVSDVAKIKFKLIDNETKVVYHKKSLVPNGRSMFVELSVSTKTGLHMNRLYDKAFYDMLATKNEKESEEIIELFD